MRYALMAAEQIDRLPAEGFGVIALRSTVHHILDVESFLKGAAAALRPGGILAFEEPCREALMLMAALCRLLPAAAAEGITPSAKQLEQNDVFCRAIEFYARRDVDKTSAEDKHLFGIGEMIEIGRRAGFEVRAFPNCSFDFWNLPEEGRRHADHFFSRSFRGYLEHVIGFGPEFGELWEQTLSETSAFVDRCALGGTAPHHFATFICHKR